MAGTRLRVLHGVEANRMVAASGTDPCAVEPGTRPNRVMMLPWRPGPIYRTATEPRGSCREIADATLALWD